MHRNDVFEILPARFMEDSGHVFNECWSVRSQSGGKEK